MTSQQTKDDDFSDSVFPLKLQFASIREFSVSKLAMPDIEECHFKFTRINLKKQQEVLAPVSSVLVVCTGFQIKFGYR